MVIGIIGENCSGKSTLAEKIGKAMEAEIITGKDYLRMARSESEAKTLFREKMKAAVSGSNIIYVISDPEHLELLPGGLSGSWSARTWIRSNSDSKPGCTETCRIRWRRCWKGSMECLTVAHMISGSTAKQTTLHPCVRSC